MTHTTHQQHLDQLSRIVGTSNCCSGGDEEAAHHTIDYRGMFQGSALAVLRPATTQEVSAIVKYCDANDIAMVPQGGNTSLLGGAVPDATGSSIVLSLARMKAVHEIDITNNTMTVDAGVTLHEARSLAEEKDRLFPLRIGSEGTCQIGGNISTNAGGTAVLRYGNMRELVLGLEVVLPNGAVWNGLRTLRKDNTGYDLKHNFIGAEGTLGIITRAVLKLFPLPHSRSAAFIGVSSPNDALALLTLLKRQADTCLTAFELISEPALNLVLERLQHSQAPLADGYPWYVLIELSANQPQDSLDALLLEALEEGAEQALLCDAAVATTHAQIEQFWRLREEISDAQTHVGGSVRCDVSVPLSRIPEFIATATDGVLAMAPNTRMIIYGHMGDGNVHFNPLRPANQLATEYLTCHGDTITQVVDGCVTHMNGSISAEHGVGSVKRDELLNVKSRAELELAWAIKNALDPKNLMNPGKVLPELP